MPRSTTCLVVSLVALMLMGGISGCSSQGDDHLKQEDVQLVNRADSIIKKANGKWEAISAEDKAYLIKEIGYGNEHNAQMYVMSQGGGLHGNQPPAQK